SVVHNEVEAVGHAVHHGNQISEALDGGDVTTDRSSVATTGTQRLCGLLHCLAVDVGHDHLGTEPAEVARHLQPHSACGPGDDADSPGEIESIHRLVISFRFHVVP